MDAVTKDVPSLQFDAAVKSLKRAAEQEALMETASLRLNAEIPRVAEAYRNLPWWDSVPILDLITESILGIKPRSGIFV